MLLESPMRSNGPKGMAVGSQVLSREKSGLCGDSKFPEIDALVITRIAVYYLFKSIGGVVGSSVPGPALYQNPESALQLFHQDVRHRSLLEDGPTSTVEPVLIETRHVAAQNTPALQPCLAEARPSLAKALRTRRGYSR